MARALVVHGHFQDIGGSENFCFRVIEILQRRFDEVVVLHAHGAPDLDLVRRLNGILFDPLRVKFISVQIPFGIRLLTRGRAMSLTLLQYAMVVRMARRMEGDFQVIVSTFSECPVRRNLMLQYIHIPMLVSDAESLYYCGLTMGGFRRRLQALYISLVRIVMGACHLIEHEITLTNSIWTKDQFLKHYKGHDVRHLYQGVAVQLAEADSQWIPFASRRNRITMIGRLTPAKRIEKGIEVVERLRCRGHEIGLDIIGNGSGNYHNYIVSLVATRPWIQLHKDTARPELEVLVARNKWGLHCYEFEHYGLAPAEMQALGCIVFVHDSGGQREIVSNHLQRYSDADQAVSKIETVLQNSELQDYLLAEGKIAAARHCAADFDIRFDQMIEELAARKTKLL